MKTLIFKKEFETKLRKLGLKTQYTDNVLSHLRGSVDSTLESKQISLNDATDWKKFILRGFTWMNSPEGHYYWESVACDFAFKHIPICTKRQIVFREEFEKKLLDLKIKQKFVFNFKNHNANRNLLSIEECWRNLNGMPNWEKFVLSAFSWRKTPEKRLYWERISKL